MKATISLSAFMLCFLAFCLLVGRAGVSASESEPQEIVILQDWRGDYPVSEFHRFPEGQRTSPIGYLGNEKDFLKVWQVFKPVEQLPDIDFSDHMVVFSRNVTFYNRIGIAKVLLKGGVAEILTIETRSAFPIEEKVGMALAVIPRTGVKYIAAGKKLIPVAESEHGLAPDPLNGTYIIEGIKITLQNGRSEKALRPDSATKIRTFVSGDAVKGDLDGDSDKDAALILVHDPGGSGTFYYVAVAVNLNGQYRGTNGVLLGDRIAPKDLHIHNGLVIVRYTKRRPHEPMSTTPSVQARCTLALDEGKLKALAP